jgi:hypothetical protein
MRLKSNQGAIKFGTESYGGFENVTVSNCQIRDTNNGGIKVLCVDGGTLTNVTISDVTMDNVKTPIFVRLGARFRTFRDGDPKKQVSTMKNVLIRNIRAKASDQAQIMPPTGIFITGVPGQCIENLSLENVESTWQGWWDDRECRAVVEEKIDTYPEINRFGKTLPAYGVYARHVQGVKLNDIRLKLSSSDLRPALVCQDVQGLQLGQLGPAWQCIGAVPVAV